MSLHDVAQNTAADVHPPLYYFLLHYWMAGFGPTSSLSNVTQPSVEPAILKRTGVQWIYAALALAATGGVGILVEYKKSKER